VTSEFEDFDNAIPHCVTLEAYLNRNATHVFGLAAMGFADGISQEIHVTHFCLDTSG
jgi:hypothetical protein